MFPVGNKCRENNIINALFLLSSILYTLPTPQCFTPFYIIKVSGFIFALSIYCDTRTDVRTEKHGFFL